MATTRDALCAHGVCVDSRVLVCHPFDPWAIGSVFRDAALACGAKVLPLGLLAAEASLRSIIEDFRPNTICGSANIVLQWHAEHGLASLFEAQPLYVHAGSPLSSNVQHGIRDIGMSRMVNVYGMAEFDTVAVQGTTVADLILAPQLDFRVADEGGKFFALESKLEGELHIREQGRAEWIGTGDRVRVVGQSPSGEPLWPGNWMIKHLGRVDDVLLLPDGAGLGAEQVRSAIERFSNIGQWQIRRRRLSGAPELLELRCELVGAYIPGLTAAIKKSLLAECLELADSIRHGSVALNVVVSQSPGFESTLRGKLRLFVEDEVDDRELST